MSDLRCRSALLALTLVGLVIVAPVAEATSSAFEVIDARQSGFRGEARNVPGGAEVIIADRSLGASLVDRLAARLERRQDTGFHGNKVTVRRARLALFIEDAFALPAQSSLDPAIRRLADLQQPDELSQITIRSTVGLRRYTAVIAGDVNGQPFATEQVIEFRNAAADARSRARVIDAALDDAVAQVTAAVSSLASTRP